MRPLTPAQMPRPDAAALARRLEAGGGDLESRRKAAQQFEAMVLFELLRPLQESSGVMGGGMGGQMARGMFHQAILERVTASGGLGLADLILGSLARQRGLEAYGHRPAAEGPAWPLPGGLRPVGAGARFGMRDDPIDGSRRMHLGVDLGAPEGAPVYPVLGGRVRFVGERGGYGTLVIVDHGGGIETRYAHLSATAVEQGEWIDGATPLGSVGSTGRSTGPHLHLEVRRDGVPVDPAAFIGER